MEIEHSKPVPPFVKFCAANIPMVFDDSLSYYEALCALWKWLQTDVIDVINNNATVTEAYRDDTIRYMQAVEALHAYVENYFANLDVQEEINNKLDAMAEDGTLQEIITTYIQSNVAWTFDNVADMNSATNLIDGSYAQTLGYYSISDGGKAIYHITDTAPQGYYITLSSGLYAKPVTVGDEINVKQCGAYGDDTHDDATAIQTAIDNYSKVYFPAGTYYIGSTLYIGANELHGIRNHSIITTHSDMVAIRNKTEDAEGIYVHDLDFLGNVVEEADSAYPKREVTYKEADYGNGMASALYIQGSNAKRYTITQNVKNVKIENCNFKDIYSLPVVVEGCYDVDFSNNYVNNCLDIGFIDNETLNVLGNMVNKSADNGISISSGNNNVTCSNNIITLSAYNGIWLSGWNVQVTIAGNTGYKMYFGPTNVICTNNVVKYCGYTGIISKWKVDNILIADNIIDTCYLNVNGSSEDAVEGGIGIKVAGYGGSNIDDEGHIITLTVYSTNVSVKNNRISNCKRGAIMLDRVEGFDVQGNSILNVGSLQKLDGTPITSSDTTYNYVVYIHNHATCDARGTIYDNSYRDNRSNLNVDTYVYNKFYIEKAPYLMIYRNMFYEYDDAAVTILNSGYVNVDEDEYNIKNANYITIDNAYTTVTSIANFLNGLKLDDYIPVTSTYPTNATNLLTHGEVTSASSWGWLRRTATNIYDYYLTVPYTGKVYMGRINNGALVNLFRLDGTFVSLS